MIRQTNPTATVIEELSLAGPFHFFPAETFPTINPVHWLVSHFAVGGYSPLRRLSGMLTAHMTEISPRNGFTWHPHRGLEIYTVVTAGELYHEDSTGGRGTLRAGDVQRMFSGEYILHQELNLSDAPARVIQIWFVADPAFRGLKPHYEQVPMGQMRARQLGDAAVRDIIGPQGATEAHVNARLTDASVAAGGTTTMALPGPEEELFLYVIGGAGSFASRGEGASLKPYDVMVARPHAGTVAIQAGPNGLRFLSFYLPPFMPGGGKA